MSGKRSRAQALRDVARAHLRSILPLALVVVLGILGLAVVAALYARTAGVAALQSSEQHSPDLATVIAVALPLVLLGAFGSLVWAGTAVQVASAAYDRRKASTRVAAWTSVKRSPRALAVIAATVGAFAGLVVATPVVMVLGVVGLARKQPGSWIKVVPFGFAVLTVCRWLLALPGVWIDGLGVRAALAESKERSTWFGVLILVLAAALTVGATEALALLSSEPTVQLAIRVAALIVIGPLPFVAGAVLYRRASSERPEPLPRPLTRRARIAVAVTLSLVVPLAIGATPTPANAAGTIVTLDTYTSNTLVGDDFIIEVDVIGSAPTGDVKLEAQPSAGPAIDLGTFPLDGTFGTTQVLGHTLPPGSYTLVATYAGDANNPGAASTPRPHTVSAPDTSIGVTSVQGSTGDTATLTITVTPVSPAVATPAGTVTVNGGTAIPLDGSGVATANVDLAPLGSRELTIAYSGGGIYGAKAVNYLAPRIPTTTNSTTIDFSVEYGDSLTLTGYVRGSTGLIPTGDVTVMWAGSAVATTTLNASGGFTVTTDELRAGTSTLWFSYDGDATHAPSDSLGGRTYGDIDEAVSIPVVSVLSPTPRIGVTTQLVATMSDLGVGPTGLVTFYDSAGTELGSARPVDGVASIDYTSRTTGLTFYASFAGDVNYLARDSSQRTVAFGMAPVTVTLDDPGALTIGQVVTLVANVKVGDGIITPTEKVTFTNASGGIIAADIPVSTVTSTAKVDVCAGDHGDCPAGTVPLGRSSLGIVATYPPGSISNGGSSASVAYAPGDGVTSMALDVNPNPVLYGSAVFLKATVTVPGTSATPTGLVTFYGVEPGGAVQFLGTDTLDGTGVAEIQTQSGAGSGDLRWPAASIRAEYDEDGAPFTTTSKTVALTDLGRIGVTVTATAVVGAAGTPSTITVLLQHDPGASEDFTGYVTVTADTGETHDVYVAAGANTVVTYITWSDVGAHTYTARYSGDVTYLPGASGTLTVNSTRRTPALGATAPTDAMADTNVTVTWAQFDATASGTVSVWADGTKWCEVGVQVLSCTGRFPNSAAGSLVDVIVRYSGDSDWLPLDQTRKVRVSRCAVLDVYPSSVTLGTVTIDTAPNCGATGYLPGTPVSITATPKPGATFQYWLGWTPTNPHAVVPGAATTTFTPTNSADTWTREAKFAASCYPVSPFATGYGGISIYPAANCTTDAGVAGYRYGTQVAIYPDGHYNPQYDEPDGFWSFGPLPAGAVQKSDSSQRPYLQLTVTQTTTVRLYFGPVCRTVSVAFSPASPGDSATFDPPHNCSSPAGGGYLRYTKVTAKPVPADPSVAITGWTLNGVAAPELGTTSEPIVEIGQTPPVLVASIVHCYSVQVDVDGVSYQSVATGEVRVDGTACPDGSDRYLEGTQVTLTPVVLRAGTLFNGWNEQYTSPIKPTSGDVGDVTSAARTLVVTRDIHVAAGFFRAESCSRLSYRGSAGLMSFIATGCGPGYYQDLRKEEAARLGISVSELTSESDYGSITADVDTSGVLGTYVSVKGDTRVCPSGSGSASEWKSYGRVTSGTFDCRASGSVTVWAEKCQPVVTDALLLVGGRSYDASTMPESMFLQGPDGLISEYSMNGFNWSQGVKVLVGSNGKLSMVGPEVNPCEQAGTDIYEPGTDLLLYAAAPSSGFQFTEWKGLPTNSTAAITQNPLPRTTTTTAARLTAQARFVVTCHTVTFGEGVHIDGPAPRCPGSSEADNSFIAGTAIRVRTDYQLGDRTVQKYSSGVVGGQIYEDPATLGLVGYAFVDGDKKVTALFQTQSQRETTAAIKGLKVVAGVAAIALPIVVGMAFPPAGIFFAIIGTLGTIATAIPGPEGAAFAGAFNLFQVDKIGSCVARWGFDTTGSPGLEAPGAVISTANTVRKVVFTNIDVLTEGVGPLGATGGALSFGYGLYSAGIGDANITGPASTEELAGKATIEGCLENVWKVTGIDL